MVQIKVNGQSEIVETNLSLGQFIADKKLTRGTIAVEYNRRIIPENEWCGIFMNENDSIEIVSFMGGG